jgi:hypothetical protein
MNADEFRVLAKEDQTLAVGDEVTVYWTSSGRYFRGRGKVSKLNEKSVKVRLEEHVAKEWYGGYPVGHQITVPRILAIERWTANNCVRKNPALGLAPDQVPS